MRKLHLWLLRLSIQIIWNCQRTYVCMIHGLERKEETEGKRLHGQMTYELRHMDYTKIKIKNKAGREQGQSICTDDIRVWFPSPVNYNIVWFLYTVKWFPHCYPLLLFAGIEPCGYMCMRDRVPTLERLILLWRLLRTPESPYVLHYWQDLTNNCHFYQTWCTWLVTIQSVHVA